MPILIIDNYDSFTFNLVQQVRSLTTLPVVTVKNDQIAFEQIRAIRPHGIIISPGPGHPANQRDFGINREIIERHRELDCPILGICLGHQGIAHYLGGSVVRAGTIVHGKSSRLGHSRDSLLFRDIPESFEAMRYHSLVVSEEDLPACLRIIAREPESGTVMAIEHRQSPLFGLQFHPESIGTPGGADIMRNFTQLCSH